MAYPDKTTPVPPVPPGSVLHLSPQDWRYGRGATPGQPVDIVIERVRDDLAYLTGGQHVWVRGHTVRCVGQHPPCVEVLVRTGALLDVQSAASRVEAPRKRVV